MADSTARGDADSPADAKKPYAKPTLIEYGSVSKLTMTKGTTIFEAPGQKQRKCL